MSISPSSIRLQQVGAEALDVGLAGAELQALLHQRAERELVEEAAIDARHRDAPALAAGHDRLAQRVAAVGADADLLLDGVEEVVDGEAVALHADGVDHGVGADAAGHLHQRLEHLGLLEVDHLGAERRGRAPAGAGSGRWRSPGRRP